MRPSRKLALPDLARTGDRRAERALEKRPGNPEPEYEVGYGKPPAHTRFQPGQSGNPAGRPRGAKGLKNRLPALNEERMKTVVLEEAYRTISIRDSDRLIDIPVIQAVIRSVALNAVKGSQKAQQMFTDLLQWVEAENKALADQWLNTAIEYKVAWERELERRRRTGETGREPLPHPDHLVINAITGEVEIWGPLTKEDKVQWDWLRASKDRCDEVIAELEPLAAEHPDDPEIAADLAEHRELRELITRIIPDKPFWETTPVPTGSRAPSRFQGEEHEEAVPPEEDSRPHLIPFKSGKK